MALDIYAYEYIVQKMCPTYERTIACHSNIYS